MTKTGYNVVSDVATHVRKTVIVTIPISTIYFMPQHAINI